MKFIIIAFVAFVAVMVASAAKTKKPIAEYFTDFAGEPGIDLIIDEDERPPTNFQGDVMKAKTTSIKTVQGKGKFNYNYETENGISVSQIGKLRDDKTFVVSGSYTYTGADGKRYRVRYTADEFGYHPVTELDDKPEIVITPVMSSALLPPLPSKQSFTPFTTSINNGNKQQTFDNGQPVNGFNQNGINKNGQNDGNNQQTLGNNEQKFNGYTQNGFNTANGQKSGNRLNSLDSRFGGDNDYTNPFNNANKINRFNSGNGYNTIDGQFHKYDRSGKSIEHQFDVIFNENFVSAHVPNQHNPENPNNLYLPPKPTYLPPVQSTYLPPNTNH